MKQSEELKFLATPGPLPWRLDAPSRKPKSGVIYDADGRLVCIAAIGNARAIVKMANHYHICQDKKPDIKFISYSGEYPSLCFGTLVVGIDGERISFGDYGASDYPAFWTPAGTAYIDDDGEAHVEKGRWRLSRDTNLFPAKMRPWLDELLKVFNENVPQGCCGGCI